MSKKIILIALSLFFLISFLGLKSNSNYSNKIAENCGSGIIFFSTKQLDKLNEFYINQTGCKMWLDQGACQIYKFGNMLFGFCKGNKVN